MRAEFINGRRADDKSHAQARIVALDDVHTAFHSCGNRKREGTGGPKEGANASQKLGRERSSVEDAVPTARAHRDTVR